jgi:uncharacterized membrane protein HdeD (DUF308 family)
MIIEKLAPYWWAFVLRGIVAILFGMLTFRAPGLSLKALILMYGAYSLSDGVLASIAAFANRKPGESFPWSILLVGIAGIAAGVMTFLYPGLTALVLLYVIAAWHIARGLSEIVVAVRLRKEIEGEGWLIAAGALSVLFGVLLFVNPGTGALALLWMIGSFALILGVILIGLGIRLRGHKKVAA